MEGFNAYIVCPQMKDEYCNNWCTDFALDVVSRLIDDLVASYNIDANRIYLMGHSQGARGVLHHSYYQPEYFAASVAFSPFDPSVSARLITIPMKAYTEYRSDFTSHLEYIWGYENVTRMAAKHGQVPNLSMHIDKDNNNRSDIIEWLFTQCKKEPGIN
jgi:predicted peptidase